VKNLSNEELVKLHDSNIVAGLTIHSFKAAANTRKEILSRLNRLEEVEKYRMFFESCSCYFAEGVEFMTKDEIYEAIKKEVKQLEGKP
jgi:hypothetical protein